MTYPIYDCSPQAQKLIDKQPTASAPRMVETSVNTHHRVKYPFSELAVGKSFSVALAEANEMSLRNLSYKWGKELNKKFAVIKHKDYGCIEVARIA